MEIDVASNAGFCFGVKRAVQMAEEVLASADGKPVSTIGEVIHNPQTVRRLAEAGLRSVETLAEVDQGALLIRSHGLPPETVEQARDKGLDLVDATCPYVHRAQTLATRLAQDGYQVVIVGDRHHPEVTALHACTGYTAVIVGSPDELNEADLRAPVAVIAQTTQPPANVESCVHRLAGLGLAPIVKKTTCTATEMRQGEAGEMAKTHEVMIVIGGRASANTTKLAAICRAAGARTYHIEGADELQADWFSGVRRVGVTAGASTPERIIKEVVSKMSEFDNAENHTEVDKSERSAATAESDIDMGAALAELAPGTHVRGKVTRVENEQVYVDIAAKTDAIIPLRELSHRQLTSPEGIVTVGDEIEAIVLRSENENGEAVLSKRRADAESAWTKLKEAQSSGAPIRARVTERVKGGLVVDVGVRGFIPGSQVGREYVADLEAFVGQELECRVIEMDEEKHNVVLSHRVIEEERQKAEKEERMATLKAGEVVTGRVKRLATFGAFVDIGGAEGLLHVSELAWGRVQDPKEVLSEGDEVKVKILRVEPETGRISLSLRQAQPDPWQEAKKSFHTGEIVSGEVVRVVDFGAFVRLAPGIEGLVHISQLSQNRVARASDAVKPGQTVQVKVLSFDPEQKRVSLSIKQATEERAERVVEHEVHDRPLTDDTPPLTLGDMFGALFEKSSPGKGGK